MRNKKTNKVKILVSGVTHSGTTFLASMLGGHTEIACIDEPRFLPFINGKDIICVKAPAGKFGTHKRKIHKFGHLMNRLTWYGSWKQVYRPYSNVEYDMDSFDHVIFLSRKVDEVVNSLMKRNNLSHRLALKTYNKQRQILRDAICYQDDRLIQITYTGLKSDPIAKLKWLCRMLEIEDQSERMYEARNKNRIYGVDPK